MLNILHTADWHIGNFPGPEKDGKNLRAEDTGMCINQLHDIALLRKPDMILFSGDLFHVARVWADRGLKEVEVAIRAFTALSQICPVVVMRGTPNHDGAEQFEMLKAHFAGDDSVHIITTPSVIRVKSYKAGTPWVNVACLPGFDRGVFRAKFPGLSKEEENLVYTEELGKIVLGLRAQCEPGLTSVLMSHYTVPGCNTESGQTQFLAQYEPVLLPETLDAAGFDLVAMGHIHRPQQVPSCQNTFYSGAINAMNFNDEGQERGFWIHSFDSPAAPAVKHTFYKTPSREFITYEFSQADIDAINLGAIDDVAQNYWGWDDSLAGKIVRILYTCNEDAHKAFNRSILERRLYADGAFWVAEISPDKVTTTTAKDELSGKTDPENNLVLYFNEKGLPDTDVGELVDLARPIITAALASQLSSQYTGAFVPICIEVKNYRNYAEASFDFSDISFCTINGQNGAGKSSLFMDAILDCLFEEPREGDLTGWIRADESARSGAIIFTFAIGDHTFRVTRTRAKSGKATLNIAEQVDGEWENRSAEKLKDTQSRIENILGMDSLTFRSCALIMQDQYGLFLQASKEDRMAILSNILGLGVYSTMEQSARVCVADLHRMIAANKTEIATLSADFDEAENLEERYIALTTEADTLSKDIETLTLRKENLSLRAATIRAAAERAFGINTSIQDAEAKKAALMRRKADQEGIVASTSETLSMEPIIIQNASAHEENQKKVQELKISRSEMQAKIGMASSIFSDLNTVKAEIRTLHDNIDGGHRHMAMLEEHLQAAEKCSGAAQEMEEALRYIATAEEAEKAYTETKDRLADARLAVQRRKADFSAEAATRKAKIEHYEAKAKMLEDSHCIDVERASCRFLADAKAAREELNRYRPECTQWRLTVEAEIESMTGTVHDLEVMLSGLTYDSTALTEARHKVDDLREKAQLYSYRQNYIDGIARDKELLEKWELELASKIEKQEKLTRDSAAVALLQQDLAMLDMDISTAEQKATESAMWATRKADLPRVRDRQAAATARITELVEEINSVNMQLMNLRVELDKLADDRASGDSVVEELDKVAADLKDHQRLLSVWQTDIGAIQEKLSRIDDQKAVVAEKQVANTKLAHKAACYEQLKVAFSQDGCPHNIIRSMLPLLTSTANTILGQMTGGKMGMEFVTDKVLKSNSKKEVPTLDIIINEYGKDSLPYLSKSGGEKVKASLSAILSLAEIKSSQAGIQLGMLFIDEPPFLDADGIQAYCDALETIQRRYKDLKVMAITHDPTMKARFPQSVDVIKTETGSRVELG